MAERKPIHFEDESEVGQLLRLVGETPLKIEHEGVIYRIEREEADPMANYDPDRAREALRRSAGALANIDIEAFKRDILKQRSQHSAGRPH